MKTKIKIFPGMGRGLVATKNLRKGETVEVAPVIVIEKDDVNNLSKTILNLYIYDWTRNKVALALGNGSLFNHDDDANVDYEADIKGNTMSYKTNRAVKKGEQLFIDYGYDPVSETEQHFKMKAFWKEIQEKQVKAAMKQLDNGAYYVAK